MIFKIPVNPSIADEESVDEADILIKTDHVKVEYEDPETFQVREAAIKKSFL